MGIRLCLVVLGCIKVMLQADCQFPLCSGSAVLLVCTWTNHALKLCRAWWNGASQGSCSRLMVLGMSGFCLPAGSPGPTWVSQCCANTLCSFASTVIFLRSDSLWLLSPFPTQVLRAFSLLTGCFMYLAMVNALYFPAPLLWLSALIYFSPSQIYCCCHGIGSSLTAKRQKEKKSLHKFPHFITCWLQFTPSIFTGVIVLFTLCLVQTCPRCIMLPGNLSVSLVLNISFWFLNNPPNSLHLVFIGLLIPLQVVHIFNTILFIACTLLYLLA